MQLRVLGFPVRIEPMFLVVMGLFGFAGGREGLLVVAWIVVAGLSILVHELGHALAFRRYGSSATIVLHGFGGYTTGVAQPPGRSVVVSLAGPFVGFAAGLLALWLSRTLTTDSVLVRTVLDDLVFVNIAWGVFNLLPILPMDGGNVVASALEALRGPARARRAAGIVSLVGAAALAVAGVAYQRPFVTMIAAFFAFTNWKALGAARDQPQMERLRAGRAALLEGDDRQAGRAAEEVLAGRTSAAVRTAGCELLAWAHLAAGRSLEADAALDRLGGGVSASQLVRSMAALAAGRTVPPLASAFGACDDPAAAAVSARMVADSGRLDQVLAEVPRLPPAQAVSALRSLHLGLDHAGRHRDAAGVGEALFERDPRADVAYQVARSWARGGRDEQALSWLERAVERGWRDAAATDAEPSFEGVRSTDRYRRLRAAMSSGLPGEAA